MIFTTIFLTSILSATNPETIPLVLEATLEFEHCFPTDKGESCSVKFQEQAATKFRIVPHPESRVDNLGIHYYRLGEGDLKGNFENKEFSAHFFMRIDTMKPRISPDLIASENTSFQLSIKDEDGSVKSFTFDGSVLRLNGFCIYGQASAFNNSIVRPIFRIRNISAATE